MSIRSLILSLLLALATGPALADTATLRAFGGVEGLTRVVDDFMVELLADARTRAFFESVDQDNVKRLLVEQFCVELGGDCTYSGRTMAESHRGLAINTAHFNALVEALQVAMSRNGVPFRAQNRLLARLAPMHRDIIEE
jgi:hemoglobin